MFPPFLPVTGSNMNYCVAAFAIVLIVSVVQWFVDGSKNYSGPLVDLEALKAGEIVGMVTTESNMVIRPGDDTLMEGNQKKKVEPGQ